jgi:hypothetical protein
VDNPDTARAQIDVIGCGERWQRALFTTYALSLAFFESYLLPRLRAAQCEHVTILTDVDGYRSSLMERRSQSVGQEYAIVPVQARPRHHGIFHPKLTYLWGEARDVLLVGSGNLTFGGHGRNLEVLEVLTSDRDPQAFRDFADFATQLARSASFELIDTQPLLDCASRASSVAGDQLGTGTARLLHSLNTPVLDQLLALANARSDWRELLVLSPYHSPDAEPIRRLVRELRIRTLKVGVPGDTTEGCTFPFDVSAQWGIPILPVRPDVEAADRTPHAKWIELRGAETWQLTGSVNATTQAFASTDNVEVGVLRTGSGLPGVPWVDAPRPPFVKMEFRRLTQTQEYVVHAELTGYRVVGRILGGVAEQREWLAQLEQAEDSIASGPVSVDVEGRFEWQPTLSRRLNDEPLQLRLTCGETSARGWIHSTVLLRLPSAARAARLAVNRLLERGDTPDDYQALIDYVGIHAGRLRLVDSRADLEAPAEPADEDFTFSIRDILAARDLLEGHAGPAHGRSRSRAQSGADVLRAIARALLGRKHAGTGHWKRPPPPDEGGDGDNEEENKRKRAAERAYRSALEEFNERIESAVQAGNLEDPRLPAAMLVWLNVNLDMRLRRLDDRSGAHAFADTWLRLAVRSCKSPDNKSPAFSETVYGVAAAVALHAFDLEQHASHVAAWLASSVHPHHWLEVYEHGSVSVEPAIAHASQWFKYDTSQMLIDGEQEAALAALRQDLMRPTHRGVLQSILDSVDAGRPPTVPEDLFDRTDLRLLARLIGRPGARPSVTRLKRGRPFTCSLYHRLHPDICNRLETHRIAECVHCHQLLVLLEP